MHVAGLLGDFCHRTLLRNAGEVRCGRGRAQKYTGLRLLARRHTLVWKVHGRDLRILALVSLLCYSSLLSLAAVVSGLSVSGEIPSCQTCFSRGKLKHQRLTIPKGESNESDRMT